MSDTEEPTRRRVLRAGVSAVLMPAALVSTSTTSGCEECDAECVATLIEVTYLLTKLSFDVYEQITGKLLWENTDAGDRLVQTLVCLIRSEDGACIQEKEYVVELPGGRTSEYDLSDFQTGEAGLYHFLVKFLGREEQSDEIEVKAQG